MSLTTDKLVKAYHGRRVVDEVSIEVRRGEVVGLLGPNGAGKTTTFYMVVGLVRRDGGRVFLDDRDIGGFPMHRRCRMGIGYLAQEPSVFRRLTVRQNLLLGAYLRKDKGGIEADFNQICRLFPILGDRTSQVAGSLSGGEQAMLALGRALMSRPTLLLMDEPSMGLAPLLVERVFELIQRINEQGTTILMVEQNARVALSIADRGYVLQTGRLALADTAQNLLDNEMMQQAYLGTAST